MLLRKYYSMLISLLLQKIMSFFFKKNQKKFYQKHEKKYSAVVPTFLELFLGVWFFLVLSIKQSNPYLTNNKDLLNALF